MFVDSADNDIAAASLEDHRYRCAYMRRVDASAVCHGNVNTSERTPILTPRVASDSPSEDWTASQQDKSAGARTQKFVG